MGIDWICTPRPREGHEAEYARLRAVALAALDSVEGFDSANWYSERHGLESGGRRRARMSSCACAGRGSTT